MSENKVTTNLQTKVEGRELIIERTFDAPREVLFKAFSDSEQLASWWGPSGWETENHQFEFKPNGVWHYCMRCTDEDQGEFFGYESWGKGVYHEILTPEKIVYTDVFSDQEGNSVDGLPEILITMEFVEDKGKTKLISRSIFESEEALQQVMEMGMIEGVTSQYECLDDFLKKVQLK